jgi:hypothetical protein
VAHHSSSLRIFLYVAAITFGNIATATADESSYIFEIPATRGTTSDEPLGEYILAALDYADPQQAAAGIEASGALDIVEIADGTVIVGIARGAVTTDAVAESDLAATFVVDYDEDSVVSAARLLRDAYGEQPTPDEIENFVFEFIEDKSYLGSFDFASKVARTRSGDCTEHAVLLAALARHQGMPARLVLGVVLMTTADDINAYGHAWTEVYFEDAWRRFDGTAPASLELNETNYYLPLLTLDDEGPGYGMDFMRLMHVHPARISEIRAVNP